MTSKINAVKAISRIDVLLAVMACLSILALVVPRHWLSYTYELDPRQYDAVLTGDTYSKGNSKVEWLDKNEQRWMCSLGQQFTNPYCSMVLNLIPEGDKGLDLSKFSRMKIWLSYQGKASYLRFYLRNRSDSSYVHGDDTSTKYNFVELPVEKMEHGIEINMADIKVADWWLVTKNVDLRNSHTEFNDVVFIEVQTGSTSRDGQHVFQLNKIEFTGSLMSEQSLYKGLVMLWTALIFSLLVYRFLKLKWELRAHKNYQHELVSINKLLNLQNKKFEDLAKTDQLTGLLNRIGIREPLYIGLKRWQESRSPFSFVLIDIDHFKRVNDVHGHDVGDEILKAAANLLSQSVRKTDFLARWGGEEFILVCPDTNLEQAHTVAESLRVKLAEATLHPKIPITASFGVATLTHADLDLLFKSADEALYEAKGLGRNCVVAKQH